MTNDSRRHLGDDLSAYIDDALGADDKRRVDDHLGGCAQCRRELDALKAVVSKVGALENKELPDGFLTRLKMKRLESERTSYAPLGWLPQPTRIAAFAATGVLAGLVFFNEVRYRLAPKILPDMATTAEMNESDGREALQAMSAEEIAAARKRLVAKNRRSAKGDWSGLAQTKQAPEVSVPAEPTPSGVVMETAKLLERSQSAAAVRGFAPDADESDAFAAAVPARAEKKKRAPGAAKTLAKAAGAPVGQAPYTNDDLRNFLDTESRRMGIRQVVPAPGAGAADDPWAGVPDRPLSKEEARQVMARVTARLRRANQDKRARLNPTVALGGSTPRILGAAPASRPVGVASAARAQRAKAAAGRMDIVKIPGSSLASTREHAEVFLEKDQAMDKVQGKKEFTEQEGRAFAAAQKQASRDAAYTSPKPLLAKGMKTEQGLEDVSGVDPMPVRRGWDAVAGGLGTAGGAVLTRPEDFADFWKRVGREAPLPAVDFEVEMIVAVFAQRSDAARRVEIVSVAKQGGRVLIRYRIAPAPGVKGPSAPYHAVVVEKSDYPYGFVQVP
jgi:hypothetical protein